MTYTIRTHRLPDPVMAIAIEPQGEIASAEAAYLLQARFGMVLAATQPERIVVDFSAVPSISDAGVDALRRGCERAAGGDARVEVVHPGSQVRDQLRQHGLAELMTGSA